MNFGRHSKSPHPRLTPEQRDEIKGKVEQMREEDPEVSDFAIAKKLAGEYGVSTGAIRFYIR